MRGGLPLRLSSRASLCAALAALVFFSRAWFAKIWGSPLPFWDQWDAEAIGLYGPWLNGTLQWQDFFRAHNEHHILLTRLADLALFITCGGWNPWAQLLLNAALHAATAAGLAAIFWPTLPPRARALFLGGLAVLFTATCGWQNALYGFQSQVYFANLFTVGAIAGLCTGTPLRARWWLGLLSAALAFFSNGGGILAPLAALVVGLILVWDKPRRARTWIARARLVHLRNDNERHAVCWSRSAPAAVDERTTARSPWFHEIAALGLMAGGVALALVFRPEIPQHAAFVARTAGEFSAVFAHCLAWPWINHWLACVVMQLPLVWLVVLRWRQRQPLDTVERCALALGLFAVLQAAAIAYSRGAVLPDARPLSRYQDPLLLGVAGQWFALLKLWSAGGRFGRTAGLVWCGVAIGGLIGLTETNFTLHLPFKRAQDRANLAIVREYAVTADPAAFTRDSHFSGPHPDPRVVQRVLDDPALRATLPASVLASEDDPVAELPWVLRHSPSLTALSAALLLGLLALLSRGKSNRPHPAMSAQTRPR